MSKTINLGCSSAFRKEFEQLIKAENDFRVKIIKNINSLVYDTITKHGGNQNNFVKLEDGPNLVSPEEDSQINRCVMGVLQDKIMISEDGNDYEPMDLMDLSTETLVDVHGSLEIEIENGTDELDKI